MSGLSKFKNRKRLSGQVEVKYLPRSLYAMFCEKDLSASKSADELTEEERKEAEAKYCELIATLKRPSEVEDQYWQRESLKSARDSVPTIEYMDYAKRKMVEHFVSVKHSPKDGAEPIQFTKDLFKEFLDYLSLIELLDFTSDYFAALREDERQAEGNATAPQ